MTHRRAFLETATAWGLASTVASGLGLNPIRQARADSPSTGEIPPIAVIQGSPRERGRQYGKRFQYTIQRFFEREILQAFAGKSAFKETMLRYAGACLKTVRSYAPIIHDEMEGMAEGSGLRLEELCLLTLHEELYHRGPLPPIEHCTAVAIGPPQTIDERTYVGQTWDWMQSVYGLSAMLEWRRDPSEGPSLLSYGFPGLWTGAGLNSAGLALCWTSAGLGNPAMTVRVGIPSYVLLTHLLYQNSLDDAIREAKRATNAGCFTFVMADGQGRMANIEGSPKGIVVEIHRERLVRVDFGSQALTGGSPDKLHPRCRKMSDLLARQTGKSDLASLQTFFSEPSFGICAGKSTIDMMVFDCTERAAYLSRGPEYGVAWKTFAFSRR